MPRVTSRRRLMTLTVLAGMVLALAGNAHATAAGSPDGSYGTDGFTVTPFGSPDFDIRGRGTDVTIDGDGRAVVLGTLGFPTAGASNDIAVLRFLPKGRLDPTFGVAGVTTIDLGGSGVAAGGLAIDARGRILADAMSPDGGALIRLLPDGSGDASFGDAGVVRFTAPSHSALEVRDLVLSGRGRPVVVGGAVDPTDGDEDAMVARFTAHGTPDATFGAGGFTFWSRDARSAALFVATRGVGPAIAAAGWIVKNGSSPRAAVLRIDGAGSLDPTFSQDGAMTYRLDRSATVEPTGIAVRRTDGETYVLSSDTGSTIGTVGLVALTGIGARDASFGEADGERIYDPTTFGDAPMDLARSADGSLVISGAVNEGLSLLMRVTSTGEPDPAFGTGGVALNADPGGSFGALTFDAKGRIVVVGSSASSDLLIGRFGS